MSVHVQPAYAAASSRHPVPAFAVGEVIGQIYEQLGPHPDVVMLFVTADLVGALDDIVATIRATLAPTVLIGSAALGVIATGQAIEHSPAISVWAINHTSVTPMTLEAVDEPAGLMMNGWMPDVADESSTLILLGDPFSFPAHRAIAAIGQRHPHLSVVGGYASGRRRPGGTRLILNERFITTGAVGLLIPRESLAVENIVSQGTRPVGPVMTVTATDGGRSVQALALEPALDRFDQIVADATDEERQLMTEGLLLGVITQSCAQTTLVVSPIAGVDRLTRALVTAEPVDVGTVVQFHVRDRRRSTDDLSAALRNSKLGSRTAAVLMFCTTTRGSEVHRDPDIDPVVVHAMFNVPAAGMFCDAVFGAMAGSPQVVTDAVSVTLFADPDQS